MAEVSHGHRRRLMGSSACLTERGPGELGAQGGFLLTALVTGHWSLRLRKWEARSRVRVLCFLIPHLGPWACLGAGRAGTGDSEEPPSSWLGRSHRASTRASQASEGLASRSLRELHDAAQPWDRKTPRP